MMVVHGFAEFFLCLNNKQLPNNLPVQTPGQLWKVPRRDGVAAAGLRGLLGPRALPVQHSGESSRPCP